MRQNIIFYFSDQQRYDTVNSEIMPNLMQLADEGTFFENCYTCQPVCGPARACLQTGVYPTECGCHINGIPLKEVTLGSFPGSPLTIPFSVFAVIGCHSVKGSQCMFSGI